MSQKNEIKILALSLLLTAGIVGSGLLWFTRNSGRELYPKTDNSNSVNNEEILSKRITVGEKSLTIGEISTSKQEGIEALANKNYQQAVENFTASLKVKPNDPETLIFLNNARIGTNKSYTLVASVPMSTDTIYIPFFYCGCFWHN
jgi:branched-chain amino acid transport system substrate-binding protein